MTLGRLSWRSDPYFYALMAEPFTGAEYKALCDAFPDESLFERMPDNRCCEGKLILSEHFHGAEYASFLAGCEPWGAFAHHVRTRLFSASGEWLRCPEPAWPRFEFALMDAPGGYHPPHRDLTQKIATLTLFFPNPGDVIEEAEFKVLKARGEGMTDYQAPLSAFDVVERVPYQANSGVLFLRGEASWHAVGPLGAGNAKRRVVTVNVERV